MTDLQLSGKQDVLTFTAPLGASSLKVTGTQVVKALKATAPVTLTDANNVLTLGLEIGQMFNLFWVAGRVFNTTIYKSNGRHSFTISKEGFGFYRIIYAEPHPDGANVVVLAIGEGINYSAWNVVNNASVNAPFANTSTSTTFIWRDQNMNAVDATFSFVVLV